MTDTRIQELLELATAEGITLPYPPEFIVAMEDFGNVVDLMTGAIMVGEANTPYQWELTPTGEAVAHLLSVGV